MTAAVVTGLQAHAGTTTILRPVSFTIGAGETVAIVGGSGSGKTTTGLALLGESPPGVTVTGEVDVPGAVGYVPQHPSTVLHPSRTVRSVLREVAAYTLSGRRPRRRQRARLDEAVADAAGRARLEPELLDRYPHALSGGQQQRVVLTQCLLVGAGLVVLDEPTTGQDPVTRAALVDELRDLARSGVALLLLSHDLDLVRALAARVLVLEAGELVEQGPVGRVLETPAHPYTRELVAAQPRSRRRGPTAGAAAAGDVSGADPGAADSGAAAGGHGALLRVAGLRAGYRDGIRRREVLTGTDLELDPGESIGLVGPSGCGKSTLLRCLAGLHESDGGRIELDGRALAPALRRRRRTDLAAVQYVAQDARAAFDPYRGVLAQVARTGVRLRGLSTAEARAEAVELAGRFRLDAATLGRRPAGLSGGQLQRAALVRALLARPRLLLCDEITSGLDVLVQARLLDELDAVRRDLDLAMVFVSHDAAVVDRVADRVLTIDGGTVRPGPPGAHVVAEAPNA